MSIVSDVSMLAWLGLSTDDGVALSIRTAVEKWIQQVACRRAFESTAYSRERYDGRGDRYLNLLNYPVIALDRLSIGTLNAVKIGNSATVGSASVSVLSTGLRLVLNGVADVTVTWVAYPTIATVVAAVNALGSGWTAAVAQSGYGALASSGLLETYGRGVLGNAWVYLEIPEEPEEDIVIYPERGQVFRSGGFPAGSQNVIVDYTAGYSASDIPTDIQLAVRVLTKYLHQRRDEETFGVASYSVNGISTTFETETLPQPARSILRAYRRGGRLG